MTELEKAARQALEALIELTGWQSLAPGYVWDEAQDAIPALRRAIEQQPANIGALGMPVNVPVTSPGSATRSADTAEAFCNDNTEEMLIDAMRSTMAVAWGYLWHITTSDKRVIGARHMLLDMIEASGLSPEEFHKIKTYGIHTAKAEGCVANMRETNWMG